MKKRQSLTPASSAPPPPGGVHATRRNGARREISSRVTLRSPSGAVFDGWALNVSRGGVRVILEEKVELAAEYEVTVADDGNGPMGPVVGRIVWVQEEPDGVVAGIEFRGFSEVMKASGSAGPASSATLPPSNLAAPTTPPGSLPPSEEPK